MRAADRLYRDGKTVAMSVSQPAIHDRQQGRQALIVDSGRSGRHDRTPLGRKDQGPRHLSRSGPLLARPFRQGERLALALHYAALDILRWFVRRWSIEVTFAEVRRHLGVETQRQWADPAIARTTPVLLALFSLVTLWASDLQRERRLTARTASWYPKKLPTFGDALAAVRAEIWRGQGFRRSSQMKDPADIRPDVLNRLIDLACYAA
jgi:hypothetical protein